MQTALLWHKLTNTVICALVGLTAVNMMASYVIYRSAPPSESVARDYTYVGYDYPERWPLPPTDPVALVIEDPIHYPIVGPDARDQWASSMPKGFGYIRLGPEHRAFSVSMFHQYHCLRSIRSALSGNDNPKTTTHFGHCLSYLRQMILCDPNLTLEPFDSLSRDFEVERAGAIHVCKDWRQAYDAMGENWSNWVEVRKKYVDANSTASVSE